MSVRSPVSTSAAFSTLRIVAALCPLAICLGAAELGRLFQPALAACVALLLVGFPPARHPSRWLEWAWLALAALPLLALLPMPETAIPGWRAALSRDLGIDLGRALTPQPVVLFAALAPFWTGLAWLWWACNQQWDTLESKVLTRALLLAIAGTAAVVFVGKVTLQGNLPGTLAGANTALATRNQLATVLAIGVSAGVAVTFCASRLPGVITFGLGSSLLCTAALAVLGSRAGWIAAGAGVTAALGAIAWVRRAHAPLLSAAALIAGGALIAFFLPGETSERLQQSLARGFGDGFRLAVQRDALGLIAEQPWTGYGLGNFDGVFPFYRTWSRHKFHTAHPESDFLWFAGEAGILAMALSLVVVVALAWLWLTRARAEPSRCESASAACGAAAAMLTHGLLDVPAHSMFAWVLAAGFAGSACGTPPHVAASLLRPAAAWMVAGVLVATSAAAWRFLPAESPQAFANDTSLDAFPDRSTIEAWLRFRPLDGQVVELRAHRAVSDGRFDEAHRDFELLSRLEPFNPVVIERALRAWRRAQRAPEVSRTLVELLRRSPPDTLSRQAAALTSTAAQWPEVASELAASDPPLAWQLDAMAFPVDLRGRTLAGLCEILAAQGETAKACRIVLYQIGPQFGEMPPPPEWPIAPAIPRAQSGDARRADSWYDVAAVHYLAKNETGAWRILRTYLALKLPREQ